MSSPTEILKEELGAIDKNQMTMASFGEQILNIEKKYPGRSALVELPGKVFGRVIDFHPAPVPGYYNKKKDLISVEILVEVKDGNDTKYAPTDPARIVRSRTDCVEIVGVY